MIDPSLLTGSLPRSGIRPDPALAYFTRLDDRVALSDTARFCVRLPLATGALMT